MPDTNPGQTHVDPAAEAAARAARSEAWQQRGYWTHATQQYWPPEGEDDEAFDRGLAGERPDADAIAAAERRGREAVLRVVRREFSDVRHKLNREHPEGIAFSLASAVAEALAVVFSECGDEVAP